MPICNFEESRDLALEKLGKICDVRPHTLTKTVSNEVVIERYWKVKTEIEINNKVVDIEFLVQFENDFPLSFPDIYLSANDYQKYKLLPHIDDTKKICTFNITTSRPNYENPYAVLYKTVKIAKQIIIDGVEKKNVEDYEEEFVAYWKARYFDGLIRGISLIDEDNPAPKNLKVYRIKPKFIQYDILLTSDEFDASHFMKYLESKKLELIEKRIFYIDEVDFKAFDMLLTNKQTIDIITKKDLLKEFKLYVSAEKKPIIIFRKVIKDRNLYLGWLYNYTLKHSGFRPKTLTPFSVLIGLEGSKYVTGIVTESFTYNRFLYRSNNAVLDSLSKQYSFLVAGIGSIGSFLINILRTFNVSLFVLVDDDYIQSENISRYFLGVDTILSNKIDAMQEFLANVNPNCDIKTFNDKLANVILNETELVNYQDYIFVCIGDSNTELWVDSAVKDKLIKKPIFYFWVEPYLAGGHCVFIHPESKVKLSDLNEQDNFKYNLIHGDEYKDSKFIKKETGCQTSFIPYSSSNVTLYLASITKQIYDIITNNSKDSLVFTWVGDLEAIKKIGLKLSNYSNDKHFGDVIENRL